ncbi:MAG: hypothetical protein ACOCSR_05460 [Wenzhouxiangella sp.]
MNSKADRTASKSRTEPWWAPHEVPDGRSLRLGLGPLELVIGHDSGQWLVRVEHGPEADTAARARVSVRRGLPEDFEQRFVQAASGEQVVISPRLADRPVVIRPYQPLFLLSGQEVTLYLSTPLWLSIRAGNPPALLREVPSVPLSDTWLGPSSREGEICYAGKTGARQRLADLPVRPHRAITPLRIRNNAPEPLPLEKVSLPVPLLSLYGAADASLWTQRVNLVREDASDQASVRVETAAPDIGRSLELVSSPRQEGRFGMIRAFGRILRTVTP